MIIVIKQEEDETKTVTFKYDPFGRRIEKKITEAPSPLAGEGRGEGGTKTYVYVYDNEDIGKESETMNAKMIVIAAGVGVGLFGNAELPKELYENLPSMTIYQYNKSVESRRPIGPNDNEYKQITNFLRENKTGWEYDGRSYAPGIVLKAPNYSINCLSDGVVINYQNEKGEWKQISKSSNTPFCGLSNDR